MNDTVYNNWATGQPDLSNANYRCVIDQRGIGWQVANCDEMNFYACEKPANVSGTSAATKGSTTSGAATTQSIVATSATTGAQTTGSTPSGQQTTATPPPNQCGNGWVNIANRCFNFDPTKRTWPEAAYSCHALGGVLATIYGQSDTNFLYCKFKIVN